MLLILTSVNDLAADYLILELNKQRLPFFRLNSEQISQAEISYSINGKRTGASLTVGSRWLDFSEVKAVWYRRSIHPSLDDTTLSLAERRFILGELRHVVTGMVLNPNVTWVNPIDKVSVAEHKLYQLRTASRLGLQIPKTLVSSDVNELRSFASEMKSGTICKPIFHGLFFDGEAYNAIYCRRLDVSSLHHDNLRHCPIMVQQEIPRIADVRATFIGPHCFVADIVGDTDLLDWRNPDLVIDYTKSKLDTKTTTRCRKLMAELGLVYGAFDFIRKTSGELVFLEINPTGEWAWLEEKLNFPMREAFIDVFYGGKT